MHHGSRSYRGSKLIPNTDEETMDNMNQSMAESLSAKVKQLKNLAFDLDSEARDQLPLLDGLGEDVESGSLRLGSSSGRLRSIGLTRGVTGRRLTCYVAFILLSLLFLFYYIIIPHLFQ